MCVYYARVPTAHDRTRTREFIEDRTKKHDQRGELLSLACCDTSFSRSKIYSFEYNFAARNVLRNERGRIVNVAELIFRKTLWKTIIIIIFFM